MSVLAVRRQSRACSPRCLHRDSAGSQGLLWPFLLSRQVPGELF